MGGKGRKGGRGRQGRKGEGRGERGKEGKGEGCVMAFGGMDAPVVHRGIILQFLDFNFQCIDTDNVYVRKFM